MTTPADIYKLMRSSKPKQAETPPPLNHNGILLTNPTEQARILRDALLVDTKRQTISRHAPPLATTEYLGPKVLPRRRSGDARSEVETRPPVQIEFQ
ncbi:hypothetical protein K3495_g448 [Podosphaera aphanis]|nr:hypothetical protein K3495_g448 [Podosphaera aphanis]